jgi:hypothetical protein
MVDLREGRSFERLPAGIARVSDGLLDLLVLGLADGGLESIIPRTTRPRGPDAAVEALGLVGVDPALPPTPARS